MFSKKGDMSETLDWTIQITPGVTNTLTIPALGVAVRIAPWAGDGPQSSIQPSGPVPSTIRIIATPSPQAPQSSETGAKSQPDTLGTANGPSDTKSSGWRRTSSQDSSNANHERVTARPISTPTDSPKERQTSRAERDRSRSPIRDRNQQWRDRSRICHGSERTRPSSTRLAELDGKIANLQQALREEYNCMDNLRRSEQMRPPAIPFKVLERKKKECRARRCGHEDRLRALKEARARLLEAARR